MRGTRQRRGLRSVAGKRVDLANDKCAAFSAESRIPLQWLTRYLNVGKRFHPGSKSLTRIADRLSAKRIAIGESPTAGPLPDRHDARYLQPCAAPRWVARPQLKSTRSSARSL